jgi:hypothetical protein
VALVVAAIGLLCVGLALMLRQNPAEKVSLRLIVEYYAALLFFLAVSVTHNGVWGERQDRTLVPHDDWLRRSVKETARAYGLAILCAWLLGTIGRSLGDIVEAIPYGVALQESAPLGEERGEPVQHGRPEEHPDPQADRARPDQPRALGLGRLHCSSFPCRSC